MNEIELLLKEYNEFNFIYSSLPGVPYSKLMQYCQEIKLQNIVGNCVKSGYGADSVSKTIIKFFGWCKNQLGIES